MNKSIGLPKFARLSLGAILALLLAIGCTSGCKPKSKPNQDVQTVRIATSKNLWCALTLIADKKGYFADHGIKAEISYLLAGRLNMEAVLSDSADIANVVEVNLAYLGLSGRTDFSIGAKIADARDYGIVSRKSLSVRRFEDLRGKRLGYSPATGSEMYVHELLKKLGFTVEDVKLVKLQPVTIQTALLTREVDAIAAWEPFLANLERAMGGDAIILRDSKVYSGVMNVAAKKSYLHKNPTVLPRLISAYEDAARFAKSNPIESQKIVSEAASIDLEVVQEIWKFFDYTVTLDAPAQIALTRRVSEIIISTDSKFSAATIPDYSIFFSSDVIRNGSERKP